MTRIVKRKLDWRFGIFAAAIVMAGVLAQPARVRGQRGSAPSGNQSTIIISLKTAEATGAKTCLLANLADGQAFTDSSNLRVTQRSHDATHGYITVSFDAPDRSYAKRKD
jgi:anti-sigma-K factor RskA